MKYAESLKKNYEFRKVYSKGKSLANKYLVVYKYKNKEKNNRLGITVSKKVGNSVVRSRVTRLIRESYRLQEENLVKEGLDIVVVARTAAKGATYHEINDALTSLLHKHHINLLSNDNNILEEIEYFWN